MVSQERGCATLENPVPGLRPHTPATSSNNRYGIWQLHISQNAVLPSPVSPSIASSQTYLRKLSGWPCGPLRTVMPDVPVEPALLGAGLGCEVSECCSVWYSLVLISQSPCSLEVSQMKKGGRWAEGGSWQYKTQGWR
jgi:hypothetical protein